MPAASASAFAPFRHPVFRAIWLATLVSNFGSVMQSTGAAWLMATIGHSAQLVALVQASATIPIMLLALFAGAVADSYDRRRVMLASQVLMLVASTALALLTVAGMVHPATLLALTLLVGVGTSLNGPAWQASIRDQVPMNDLPAAIALNSIGFNLARSLGPALGGAVMAAFGPAANFALNALSYVALIVVLLRWRPAARPQSRREPLLDAIRRGVRYARATSPIRRALGRAGVFGTLSGALWALMPLVARDLMGGDQLTYGVLLGGFGAGAIGGAIAAARLRVRASNEAAFVTATLLFAAATLAAATISNVWVALPLLMLGGMGWVMALSTVNVVVQTGSAPDLVGRVLSLYHMFAFGGVALGSYLFGLLADLAGLETALLVAGFGLAASALLSLRWPLATPEPAPLRSGDPA